MFHPTFRPIIGPTRFYLLLDSLSLVVEPISTIGYFAASIVSVYNLDYYTFGVTHCH
nr:MAG TPA: hypothetical protein [Caudoviricetes sp.]